MPYYNLTSIRAISSQKIFSEKENAERKGKAKMSLFLSHSHHDQDLVNDIIRFFWALNVDVYVDWLDKSMPAITSAETAQIIKNKIESCDKFVVLLTENSKNSKWVPWELGYADGKKRIDNISIFPVKRYYYEDFKGVEYMDLYPQIKEGYNNGTLLGPAIFKGNQTAKWLAYGNQNLWLAEKNLVI